jgi:hypothetical protein
MFENVSAQGAWQGYQVSLCKSRPKCSPTRFLSKLTLSLNHGTCGLFLQLKNLFKVNNHPKCENSPNLAILGYIAKCRMLLGQVCKVGADLHESSLIRLWSSYIHMCKYIWTNTYEQIHMYKYICTNTHVQIPIHIHLHKYICTNACVKQWMAPRKKNCVFNCFQKWEMSFKSAERSCAATAHGSQAKIGFLEETFFSGWKEKKFEGEISNPIKSFQALKFNEPFALLLILG